MCRVRAVATVTARWDFGYVLGGRAIHDVLVWERTATAAPRSDSRGDGGAARS